MSFADELTAVLPFDLPHRGEVIAKGARHLELLVVINRSFNLTRITGEREAAIKHVLDSVLPWRHFAGRDRVLDAGTGAGFPGIPLALVLPEVRFTLAESVGKKARFADAVVRELDLKNVRVENERAEEVAETLRPDRIAGRAVAKLERACALFAPAVQAGSRVILYKGPDSEMEIVDAAAAARKYNLTLRVIDRYELPDGAGVRKIIEMS